MIRRLASTIGFAALCACACLCVHADPVEAVAEGTQGSADLELLKAREVGWTAYSTAIYNRVNNAYVDGLTSVDPADIWTNYACVAAGDTLTRLGEREVTNVDIVMRTHLATSSVFIIQDGTMKRDPYTFRSEEMYAIVTMMQGQFSAGAKSDPAVVAGLQATYDGCARSLRAENRTIAE